MCVFSKDPCIRARIYTLLSHESSCECPQNLTNRPHRQTSYLCTADPGTCWLFLSNLYATHIRTGTRGPGHTHFLENILRILAKFRIFKVNQCGALYFSRETVPGQYFFNSRSKTRSVQNPDESTAGLEPAFVQDFRA